MNNSFGIDVVTNTVKLSSRDLIGETAYDKWNRVGVCENALCKRIKTPNEYHGFLIRYETGARSLKHQNSEEYEILDVRVGSITNLVTGDTYSEGDVVVFEKGEEHEILCEEEAYVFCVMSKSRKTLG